MPHLRFGFWVSSPRTCAFPDFVFLARASLIFQDSGSREVLSLFTTRNRQSRHFIGTVSALVLCYTLDCSYNFSESSFVGFVAYRHYCLNFVWFNENVETGSGWKASHPHPCRLHRANFRPRILLHIAPCSELSGRMRKFMQCRVGIQKKDFSSYRVARPKI